MTTSERIQALIDATYQGEEDARSLLPGQMFDGAMPSAARRGIARDSAEGRCYMHAYVDAVQARWPRGVPVDGNGFIR